MADEFITFELRGLAELEANLKTLDDEVQTKIVRDAVRAGAKVVKDEVVLRAPKDSGLLSEHIDIKTRKQKSVADAVTAFIGPNGKQILYPRTKGTTAGMKRTAAKIASFFEFGKLKHPFITQAWEVSKLRALDTMIEKIKQGLAKWSL